MLIETKNILLINFILMMNCNGMKNVNNNLAKHTYFCSHLRDNYLLHRDKKNYEQ